MKKNIGLTDKAIRVLMGVIIAALYFLEIISGTIGAVLVILAIILLLTSLLNFCPIYRVFGWSSCQTK
jgi:hypothetical protein